MGLRKAVGAGWINYSFIGITDWLGSLSLSLSWRLVGGNDGWLLVYVYMTCDVVGGGALQCNVLLWHLTSFFIKLCFCGTDAWRAIGTDRQTGLDWESMRACFLLASEWAFFSPAGMSSAS